MDSKVRLAFIKSNGKFELHWIDIPDGVDFMCDPNEIGYNRIDGCLHYFTIVPTEKYGSWIDGLPDCVLKFPLGEYTIIIFSNIHEETPLDYIGVDDFFSRHDDIDLKKYTILKYDFVNKDVPAWCYRIVGFRNPWRVAVYNIVKDSHVYYNADCYCWDLSSHPTGRKTIYLVGDEGESWWSNMIHSVIGGIGYDATKVDKDFDWYAFKEDDNIGEIVDMKKG